MLKLNGKQFFDFSNKPKSSHNLFCSTNDKFSLRNHLYNIEKRIYCRADIIGLKIKHFPGLPRHKIVVFNNMAAVARCYDTMIRCAAN